MKVKHSDTKPHYDPPISPLLLLSRALLLPPFLCSSSPTSFTFQANLPLPPCGYPLAIHVFREAWAALREHTNRDISEINSIHVIVCHLEDFYAMTGESLVKVSDHTVEAAHQWLHKGLTSSNFWCKDITSRVSHNTSFRPTGAKFSFHIFCNLKGVLKTALPLKITCIFG